MKYIFIGFVALVTAYPTYAKKNCSKMNPEICIEARKTPNEVKFIATSSSKYDYVVRLWVTEVKNYSLTSPMPLIKEVRRGSLSPVLLTLKRTNKKQKAGFGWKFKWWAGRINAQHDNSYIYQLPFAKGTKAYVSQSYYGSFSHKNEVRFAVDFKLPVGTPIHAARDGVVAAVKQDSSEGGPSPQFKEKGNYIKVAHSDGTVGAYVHIKQNGSAVRIGQRVKVGELLGYSGNTGFSSMPHLHFDVQTRTPQGTRDTIQTKFISDKGVSTGLNKNTFYSH